jgi:hypothetical protein
MRERILRGVSRQPTEADLHQAREALVIAIETARSPDFVGQRTKNRRISKSNMKGVRPIKFGPLSTQTKSIINRENGSRLRLREIFLYVM